MRAPPSQAKTATYRVRTLSNERKYGWLRGLNWIKSKCEGGVEELTKPTSAGTPRMPPARLTQTDALRALYDPASVDLPFVRLAQTRAVESFCCAISEPYSDSPYNR